MVPMVQKKWNPWFSFHLVFEKKIQVLILEIKLSFGFGYE
jgi:hypothetical protein